jgi:hypothetical protein
LGKILENKTEKVKKQNKKSEWSTFHYGFSL